MNRARKTAILIGTACLLAGIFTTGATSAAGALAWICVTCFGFQFWVGNVQTLPSDYLPVGAVGSIAGFSGTAAGLGAVIFTTIFPHPGVGDRGPVGSARDRCVVPAGWTDPLPGSRVMSYEHTAIAL